MSELKQEFDAALAQLIGPGAPWEIATDAQGLSYYANAPVNLREALYVARDHGDREFLIYEGERRTFNQLLDEADALGAALQGAGVGKGDRVALAMRNYPEWMSAFIAVTAIGAVVVPINSWGSPADVHFAVTDAGAKLAICDQQRADAAGTLLQDAGVQVLIARPADANDPAGLPSFVAAYAGKQPAHVDIDGDDLALIMYTSGTSGKPKGAASTHRALCQAVYNIECFAIAAAMTNGDLITAMLERGHEPTSLLAVPLFHVSGCHAQFLVNLRGGRRIVMMYKWDVDRALQYIEQERVTTLAAAPSMALDLLEAEGFDTTDTSSLFSLGVGGAATPPRIRSLLNEKMPQNFSGTGYGMTETNAQGSSLTGRAFRDNPGTSGFPHPVMEFRIRDEAGADLPQGDAGEIWVRGVTVIKEYWNRPDANASDFEDGWMRTGDIGYFDEDGLIYLADRAKDMIIRGGENIYPIEIENELLEHPAVKEVAVVGLPHERWGERVVAVAHLHPKSAASEQDLIDFAAARLAAFKAPSQVFISDQPLPRNAANKLLKREIKEGLPER
ncbi:class I adenylate-forming enzyme family protein [Halioglobus maricola]|nr:class I adenylate-forming enzyme family protein [Halioglobus maricola]